MTEILTPVEINSKDISIEDLSKKNVIFGIPGSGKTTAIEKIIEKIKENHFSYFYLTYSRTMAAEARERIDDDRMHIGTLHSIISKILSWKAGNDGIFISDAEIETFCKKFNLKKMKKVKAWEETLTDDTDDEWALFSLNYDKAKNSLKGLEEMKNIQDTNYNPYYLAQKWEEYKKELKKKDYTDILVEVSEHPEILPNTDYLFIDESQDLTPLMWDIIEKWSKKAKVVVLAGDDDQSIYAFKGAKASNFLKQRIDAKIFHLAVSYRVPTTIRDFAVSILEKIKDREKKNFISANDGGEVKKLTSLSEFVKQEGKKYILARTRYVIEKLVPYLDVEGIPFLPLNPKHSNISPWSQQLIQLTNAIAKFPDVIGPSDIKILIQNSPASVFQRGVKSLAEKSIDDLIKSYSQNLYSSFSFTYLLQDQNMSKEEFLKNMNINPDKKMLIKRFLYSRIDEDDVCYVDTLHSAKGMEADHIAIVMDITERIYENLYDNFDDELRLIYVGATRAKKSLNLIDLGITGISYDIFFENASASQHVTAKKEDVEAGKNSVFNAVGR
jgi:DNA helicase-2/ATP-dependent DNA helicase PcrA